MTKVKAPFEALSFAGAIWILALIVIAWASIGTELDFSTQKQPEPIISVPLPFRAFAWEADVHAALKQQNTEGTAETAKKLIAVRPVPARNLSLLASVAILRKDQKTAGSILQVTVQRGWRDLLSQLTAFNGAANFGEWKFAVQRFIAMRKTQQPREFTIPALETLANNPAGRIAYAQLLPDNPNEAHYFLTYALRWISPETYASIIQQTSKNGVYDCAALARATTNLLKKGAASDAQLIWHKSCGEATPIASISAGSQGEYASPFAWTFPSQPGLLRHFEKKNGEAVISYHNSDNLKRNLASRLILLAPGQHRINLSTPANQSLENLNIILRCAGGNGHTRVQRQSDNSWMVQVPSTACSVQKLIISVPRGRGTIADIVIE
ncbi:hypothetical protein [Altericroceibacterium spongiae]|uniref:hypothetical protein n=1 Tax=Altericroceibacterium spongiae TaxID=2320269 RepID=UPI0011C38301|nr:hypothetical protein [Altericroceibacterium spongiae]